MFPSHDLRQFLIYKSANQRWLAELDESTPSTMHLYPIDGFDTSTDGYYPFGPADDPNTFISRLMIVKDTGISKLVPSLEEETDGAVVSNNKDPEYIENPRAVNRTVCAFMLYRSSYYTDSNGEVQPSTDFALPNIHHAQAIADPSFMANPAIWLTATGRVDEVDYVNDRDTEDFITQNKTNQYLQVGAKIRS